MAIVFITGISTSGKSTVAKRLRELGYDAYDTEHDGMSAWYDKATGERVAEFGQVPKRTKAWLDSHEWRISINQIKEAIASMHGGSIFFCGGGANEQEVIQLCTRVIWLKTTEKTIRDRVSQPRDHTYGTYPHELAEIISANRRKEAKYATGGAILVDATQASEVVVAEILKSVQ